MCLVCLQNCLSGLPEAHHHIIVILVGGGRWRAEIVQVENIQLIVLNFEGSCG